MIKVLFPPGCYGHYITRSIYHYTNLRVGPFEEFKFDSSGSSHQFWDDLNAPTMIDQGHLELEYNDTDQLVVVLPCQDHTLDYCNNNFFKWKKNQIIEYISHLMLPQEAIIKLNQQWSYTGKFDDTIPKWIIREWTSFWINDMLNDWADPTKYKEVNSVVQFSTQDIFENWSNTLTKVVTKLGLTFSVDQDIIQKQHKKFLALQKLHNSQHRCHQYVNELLVGNDIKMTIHSIFDEAYIQHLLRQHGLEIQCNELNIFPTTTQQLKNLTYETMHNTNT